MMDLLARVTVSDSDLVILTIAFGLLATVLATGLTYLAYNLALFVFGLVDGMSICVSPVLMRLRIGHCTLDFTDTMFWSALANVGTLYLLDRPIILDTIAGIYALYHLAELVRKCTGPCLTYSRQLFVFVSGVCVKLLSTTIKAMTALARTIRRAAYTTGGFLFRCLCKLLRCALFTALVCLVPVAEAAVIWATMASVKVLGTLVLLHGHLFLETISDHCTHFDLQSASTATINLLGRITSEIDLIAITLVFGLLATFVAVAYNVALFVFGLVDRGLISTSPVLLSVSIGRCNLELTDTDLRSALGTIGALYLADSPIVPDGVTCVWGVYHIVELVRKCTAPFVTLCGQVCAFVGMVCFKGLSTAFQVTEALPGKIHSVAYIIAPFLVRCFCEVLRCALFTALVCITAVVEVAAIWATTTFMHILVTLVLGHGYLFLHLVLAPYTYRLAILSFALKAIPHVFNVATLSCATLVLLARYLVNLWRDGYDLEYFAFWLVDTLIAGCERMASIVLTIVDHACALAIAVARFFFPHHFADDTSLDWPVRLPVSSSASSSSTLSSVADDTCKVLPGDMAGPLVHLRAPEVDIEVLDRYSEDNAPYDDYPPSPQIVWRYRAFDQSGKCIEGLPYYHLVDEETGEHYYDLVPEHDHPVYSTIHGREHTYSAGAMYGMVGQLKNLTWFAGLYRPTVVFVLAFDTARIEEVQEDNVSID